LIRVAKSLSVFLYNAYQVITVLNIIAVDYTRLEGYNSVEFILSNMDLSDLVITIDKLFITFD